MALPLMKTERQERALEFVQSQGRATVTELSLALTVSESTVRRDLRELAEDGRLRRTHGGALKADVAAVEGPIIQRAKEQLDQKRRIAKAAAELTRDGETLLLGSGTTTLEVARALVGQKKVTVVTNALNIAELLSTDPT